MKSPYKKMCLFINARYHTYVAYTNMENDNFIIEIHQNDVSHI